MLIGYIIGKLILGQGAAPLDFNGLAQYGALGFFIMYLIYREWNRDRKQEKVEEEMARKHNELEEKFNKYMLEDRERITAVLESATKIMSRLENKLDK